MVTFSQMKKNRQSEFERINSKLKSITNPTFKDPDEAKFWEPVADKNGNGYALIRFMPTPQVDSDANEEAEPIVQWWSHGFKGPGGWYIEKSRTTLGEADPCGEMNSKLWASGEEKNKKFVSGDQTVKPAVAGSKRKENFVANITVIDHPGRPEDNGKQFPFKFGRKLFQKLYDAQNPKNPTKTPFNPFDLWEGANFALVFGKNQGGYRNYDDSSFNDTGPLYDDEDQMEAAWKACESLAVFIDPKKFKTYDQLKARLDKIMGAPQATTSVEQKEATVSKAKQAPAPVATHDDTPPWEDGEDDDDLAAFKKLVTAD